jgi:lipopolysaccharide/colanic/teichoic acid biosynthesis glycosyltransferase
MPPFRTEVLTREEFRRVLVKERARVDRFGGEVSLLVLKARDAASRERSLSTAIEILSPRIRTTDELGWFDSGSLGVLLPGTDAEGAWRVADVVAERHPDDLPPPVFSVYAYPHGRTFPGALQESSDSGDETDARNETLRPVMPLQAVFVQPMPLGKRALDVILSSAAMIGLLPLFLVVAVAIKLNSKGPVLYSQKRMGRGREPFSIFKFRTMVVDADEVKAALMSMNEADGPAFKITNDPRVTRVGRFLRATCIDELPQLWNVLRGEMSLVGPRPLAWDEAVRCLAWQTRRFDVTPGLTCLWQIQDSRNSIPFADWMRLDLHYVKGRSLWEDVRLIWKTGVVVLGGRGI